MDGDKKIAELERKINGLFELSGPSFVRTNKDFSVKELFTVSDIETKFLNGQRFRRTMATAAVYSMAANEYLVAVTSLATAPTIGLPDARLVGTGKHFIVKDEVGGALTTNVTIVSANERTIDGASSTTLATDYAAKEFYSDGSNWFTK